MQIPQSRHKLMVVWCGFVGMVWYGSVWYGLVWLCMVCYGMTAQCMESYNIVKTKALWNLSLEHFTLKFLFPKSFE